MFLHTVPTSVKSWIISNNYLHWQVQYNTTMFMHMYIEELL
jgi:hypothetical protein